MFTAIVGTIKSLFAGINALFSFLSQRMLLEAGRGEAEREAALKALKAMGVSDEVDHRPLPPNVLDCLRRPPNGSSH